MSYHGSKQWNKLPVSVQLAADKRMFHILVTKHVTTKAEKTAENTQSNIQSNTQPNTQPNTQNPTPKTQRPKPSQMLCKMPGKDVKTSKGRDKSCVCICVSRLKCLLVTTDLKIMYEHEGRIHYLTHSINSYNQFIPSIQHNSPHVSSFTLEITTTHHTLINLVPVLLIAISI